MAKLFGRFTSMFLFIPLLLFSIKFTTSTNNIEQVGPIAPPGRVFEADIDSLGPEELENVKNKIAEIVDGLTEYEKVAESAHFDNELMNDDPFVYDLQLHDDLPEQEKLSVRALINTWNKLVYSRDHLDGYGDQLELQERSANKACSNPCHPYASCISGTCQCEKGFYKNQNEDCEDKNECLTPNICGKNQECLNLFGSYKCQCKTGFLADKNSKDLKCIDLDECREGIHQCDPEAKCINTEGSYKCLCELQSIDIKPQKKCPKPASILDCKPNKIEITITKVHFKKFVPAKNALKKNPAVKFLMFLQPNETMDMSDNCTLKLTNKSSLSYKFSILPPFNACSTVQTIDHSNTKTPSVIYRNTLWWSVLLPKLPFVIIPYKMYEIECKFPLKVNQFEKNATVVVQSFQNRTYKKDGQSKISMKFWRIPPSKSYSQPALSVPMEFEIGEVLYVTVELEKDGVLPDKSFIYLDHCYLSPTPQITKIRTDIVVNGCPSIINLKHGILSNGVSRVSTFYFQMVHFHGLGASLFIDCDIVVCERICEPNCPTNRKKRASLNETESLGENQIFFRPGNVQVTRMSSGPITAIQPVTIKKNKVEKEVKIIKSEVQVVRKTDETNVDNPDQPKTRKTQGELGLYV
uniref:uncharacterized protein LOC120340068 n=1 Tax=Styela clava TaxID=7725 RepID=UPI001939E6F6|nr:uncharacterized protein LOC120340068 [Styela clava]